MLVAFQRFTPEDWGLYRKYAPASIFNETWKDTGRKPVKITFSKEIVVTTKTEDRVGKPAPDLKGRGTCIVLAESDSINPRSKESKTFNEMGMPLIIKACWPERTRLNEATVIRYAYHKLLADPENSHLAKHLPFLIASLEDEDSDTPDVLKGTGLDPAPTEPKPRVFRLHVFPHFLAIDKLESEEQFIKAWFDCVQCHYALWKQGIEHGDISIWNLMWNYKDICGILNDWDLAHVRDGIRYAKTEGKVKKGEVLEGEGGERTGTLPFLARDLLALYFPPKDDSKPEPIKRLYRHEVESFIWVFVWRCVRKDSPGMLDKWRSGTPEAILGSKNTLLMDQREKKPKDILPETWRICDLLCLTLFVLNSNRKMLRKKFREPTDDQVFQLVKGILAGEIVEPEDVVY